MTPSMDAITAADLNTLEGELFDLSIDDVYAELARDSTFHEWMDANDEAARAAMDAAYPQGGPDGIPL